jgi:hypothetical protein
MCHLCGEISHAKAGGESGIRTHGRVSPTHAFQACSFNHSDISPFDSFRSLRTSPSTFRLAALAQGRPCGRPPILVRPFRRFMSQARLVQ